MEVEDECCICHGTFLNKTTIPYIHKDCKHEFCQHCIVQWLKTQSSVLSKLTCPICRREIHKNNYFDDH